MNIVKLLATPAAGVALALSAACTPASDTSAPRGQRAKQGAIGGAVAVVPLGAAITDQEDGNILEGALLGGLAGGTVDGFIVADLDRQATELRASLPKEATVSSTDEQIEISLPEWLLFDIDSDVLKRGQYNGLPELALSLNYYPETDVWIIGHTDSIGAATYNQKLSERRARAIKIVLLEEGVSHERITSFGRGENIPVADNGTESGRRQNRRVEVIIRPERT